MWGWRRNYFLLSRESPAQCEERILSTSLMDGVAFHWQLTQPLEGGFSLDDHSLFSRPPCCRSGNDLSFRSRFIDINVRLIPAYLHQAFVWKQEIWFIPSWVWVIYRATLIKDNLTWIWYNSVSWFMYILEEKITLTTWMRSGEALCLSYEVNIPNASTHGKMVIPMFRISYKWYLVIALSGVLCYFVVK